MFTTDEPPKIKSEPKPGVEKRVLWSGKPKQGVFFTFHDFVIIPSFAVLAYAISIVAVNAVMPGEKTSLFSCVVFALFAYLYIAGQLFYDRKRRANASYEIMGDSIVIHRKASLFSDPVTTLSLHSVPNSIFIDHKDGTGSIIFLDRFYDMSDRMRRWRERMKQYAVTNPSYVNFGWVAAFERIENADEVFAIIQKIQGGERLD